jgi:hypothetical protein
MIRSLPPVRLLMAAAVLCAGAPALAQTKAPAPAPAASAPAAAPYEIKGFRSAAFGMTKAQVLAAIAADFGPSAKAQETLNPVEGTQVLLVKLDKLEPGPGPAALTYIFGAASKTLSHVNVAWVVEGEATPDQRQGIVTAAVQLTSYFQTLPNPPKATSGVTPTGPNGLIMYAAVDGKGAGLEVAVDGIAYQNNQAPSTTPVPAPKGPALLRISYFANALNPDVYKIKPGSF